MRLLFYTLLFDHCYVGENWYIDAV